jgi:hypothetical protein
MYLIVYNTVNLLTLNDLQNAQATIEESNARDIISQTCSCVIDRMEYIKKISSLDAKDQPSVIVVRIKQGDDLRKKFA